MKLFFVKGNSAYTIFKTLDKIPKNKQVEIFIDPEHELLEDDWWGKQFRDKFQERNIDATFVTKNEKCRDFFHRTWCQVKYQWRSRLVKWLHTLYTFLFNIKKFHLHTLHNNEDKKNKYTFYIVVAFEVIFVILILLLLYMLILPTTTVTLTQSQDSDTIIYNFRYYPHQEKDYPDYSRYISIPYYTWHLDYKYDLSINIENIRHIQNPSQWKIKIINKIPNTFDFVAHTKFITENGLLFESPHGIHIPAAYENIPGEKIITLQATKRDNDWLILWSRGNIKAGTILYVKNFKPSLLLKKMIAVSLEDFHSQNSENISKISSGDIAILSGELHKYIEKNKLNLTKKVFNLEDSLLLNFDTATTYTIVDTHFNQKVGQESNKVNWTITARLRFMYVKWDDLTDAFEKYLAQRPMKTNTVLSLDKNSFYIFDDIQENTWIYIIPTKINIIKWYDFSKDINGIIPDIKNYIIWKSKSDARDYILKFPEVSTVGIKIRPRWYTTIPQIKSRIQIHTEN